MGIRSWLVEKEKRFAWSLLGAVIGILSVSLGYLALQEKHADIDFIVTNEANVLDVRTSVSDLEIEFKGQNLQKENLNLRILTIRIENTGQVDILQSYYDQHSPWGFKVTPGSVIETRILDSNSDYLKQNVQPVIANDSVTLEKVIFEQKKFVILEILTIHPKGSNPQIQPFGKIAGIDKFDSLSIRENESEVSFWSEVISGSAGVQAVRLLAYPLGFVLLMIGVALLALSFSSIADKIGKRRRIKDMSLFEALKEAPYRDFFSKLYIDEGKAALFVAKSALESESDLQERIPFVQSLQRRFERRKKDLEHLPYEDQAIFYDGTLHTRDAQLLLSNPKFSVIHKLLSAKMVIIEEDEGVLVENGVKEALNELLGFLEIQGKLKKKD